MSRITAKRLKKLIEKRWPHLEVRVESWTSNTDRDIPGTRLRHPGRGRAGSRITVTVRRADIMDLRPLLVHTNSETYRRLTEVVEWMRNYANSRGERIPRGWRSVLWCGINQPTWEQLTGGKKP